MGTIACNPAELSAHLNFPTNNTEIDHYPLRWYQEPDLTLSQIFKLGITNLAWVFGLVDLD